MKRGDVVWVDLDPVGPDEAAKTRPCVVVSNEGANSAASLFQRGMITIVPLTSNVTSVYGEFQRLVDDPDDLLSMGLSMASKIQAEQVRSVSVRRLGKTLGSVPPSLLREIDDALRFQLSL